MLASTVIVDHTVENLAVIKYLAKGHRRTRQCCARRAYARLSIPCQHTTTILSRVVDNDAINCT
jgi:hypothetical protein